MNRGALMCVNLYPTGHSGKQNLQIRKDLAGTEFATTTLARAATLPEPAACAAQHLLDAKKQLGHGEFLAMVE
jgi:hypothetical protein